MIIYYSPCTYISIIIHIVKISTRFNYIYVNTKLKQNGNLKIQYLYASRYVATHACVKGCDVVDTKKEVVFVSINLYQNM